MNIRAIAALLSQRDYALYAAANAVSLTGTWIHRIAIGWLAWEYTHSPLWVGILAASGVIPILIVGPIGGVLADQLDQRKQIAVSQSLAFVLMMVLFVFYEQAWLNIWWLVAFRITLTALVSLSQPARLVLVPSLAGPENMATAISFGALVFNLARFLGPAAAGVLLVGGDFGIAFLVNGFSYLALVLAVLKVRLPEAPEASPRKRRGLLPEIGDSIAYIRGHNGILAMFLLFGVVVIAGRPIAEMIPAFVGAVFSRGVDGLAILTSAMAAGSIAGGLVSTHNRIKGLTRTVVLSTLGYGVCIVLFVWMPVFWMAVGVLSLASVFTVMIGVSAQTLVQTAVEPALRGRVMSLWFILSRGGPSLGALVVGLASEAAGLRLAFSVGGLLCIAAGMYAWKQRHAAAPSLEHGPAEKQA
ncbi:MAG: MFS transporter [Rhodospirillaceae bacterium]|nr:MFS transporter [Rhodospirillaceae bacterium]